MNFMQKNKEEYKHRFKNGFSNGYKKLGEYERIYNAAKMSQKESEKFVFALKNVYDQAWKVMEEYLYDAGILCFLPREILKHFCGEINIAPWIAFIEEYGAYFKNPNDSSAEKLIKNYFLSYKKAFDEFSSVFGAKLDLPVSKKSRLVLKKYPNRYVLDSYMFFTLTEFFKRHPKIHVVRIFGDRADGSFRCGSYINLFMAGSYTKEEFVKIQNRINMLRHPYFVYITDLNSCNQVIAQKNLTHSILLYDKKDFM